MSLLAKSRKEGQIQHITPQSAGWRYIGFDVWMLKKGQTVTLESGDRELCLVLVAGLASVKTQQADFPNLGKRMSPFERTPPWSVYVPPQDRVEVTADSDLELAVCSAPGKGSFPARLIRPEDVASSIVGKGATSVGCIIFCRTAPRRIACWWWKSTPTKGPPARGRRISTIPPSRAKKRSWKRPTITASIRRRALPSSGSTPTTAAWTLHGAL